jgi:Fe-S-cluster containining protein
MNIFVHIPPHTNCRKCGDCCGPVMASVEEIKAIFKYMESFTPEQDDMIRAHKKDREICVFLNRETRLCMIYPVRPLICRYFGVVRGMNCKHGNSQQIDGLPILFEEYLSKQIAYFRDIDWERGNVIVQPALPPGITVDTGQVSGGVAINFRPSNSPRKDTLL